MRHQCGGSVKGMSYRPVHVARNCLTQVTCAQVIRVLLAAGESVEGAADGMSPLQRAIRWGHPDAAVLLVEQGHRREGGGWATARKHGRRIWIRCMEKSSSGESEAHTAHALPAST